MNNKTIQYLLIMGLIILIAVASAADPALAGITELVSISTEGVQGNGHNYEPIISYDGRYVGFYSSSTNLVQNDINGATIDGFIRDRLSGTTEIVTQNYLGQQVTDNVFLSDFSEDARYVTFYSLSDSLVPDDINGQYDVFVRDRATESVEMVSVSSTGELGNNASTLGMITPDGRYVVFQSYASNLVPGDTNNTEDIFRHDRVTGTTQMVNLASDGTIVFGLSAMPAISADGRFVTFTSSSDMLVPGDTNFNFDVFVHDIQYGTNTRVSVSSTGEEGNSSSYNFFGSISANGRYVVFLSDASNLVPGDTNFGTDVFVHDRETGITERVSVSTTGLEGNDRSPYAATISADGRFVSFYSQAGNLVPDDTNGRGDYFVRDRLLGTTERVSLSSQDEQGWGRDSAAVRSDISANGRYVAFGTLLQGLVPEDTNPNYDIFVRTRTINTPPVAAAGPDQVIIEIGTMVQLDGSGSYDDDGDEISFLWEITQKPEGSLAALSDPTIAGPVFEADVHGDYQLEMTVTDQWSDSASDTVIISFENVKPVADAGTNQSVLQGEAVYLDGGGSHDANLDDLTYSWSIVSEPEGSLASLDDSTSTQPSFTSDLPGLYVIELKVNDGFVDSDPDIVQVVAITYLNYLTESLQDLGAVINGLDDDAFKNSNMKNALTNKINAVIQMVQEGSYGDAFDKLSNDILAKTDGCAMEWMPDNNDWLITCEAQDIVYPLVIEILDVLAGLQ